MIPSTSGFLNQEFTIEEQPSQTYKMDLNVGGNTTKGYTDNLEAMKQAVFKALNTERYKFIMYSWNYGIETEDLYGQPVTYVAPELERRITEALLVDGRITNVTDFRHDLSIKSVVHTLFTVHTIFGEIESQKEVRI